MKRYGCDGGVLDEGVAVSHVNAIGGSGWGRGAARLVARTMGAALLLCGTEAGAEGIRYHGFQLDEQHHLLIEESEGGIVKIGLRFRTRPVGGLHPEYTQLAGEAETGRLEGVEYLAQVRSQVIKPSPPNYFQSHGELYRITVSGIEEGPDYYSVREVNAGDARRTVAEEFRKMWVRMEGVRQEALYWSVPIILSVFKEADRMPAPVYTTVAKSVTGEIRMPDATLTRRTLPGGRKLGPRKGFRRYEMLTGKARVYAEMAETAPGAPSERAGAFSYEPLDDRAVGIKPKYIKYEDPRAERSRQERRGRGRELPEEEISRR